MSSEQELPGYYHPGATLSLSLNPNDDLLNVQVIRAFTPFTMSQVILVERSGEIEKDNNSHSCRLLPKTFLAKIYDPRFISHRLAQPWRPARPWSVEAENKAAAARRQPRDPDFKPWNRPESGDLPGCEEFYFQISEGQYHSEVTSYEYLQVLQGSAIPRCYGTGSLRLSDRAISPHVLFLEFLPDAESLALVNPKVVSLSLLQSLLDAADKFGPLGVVHTDLNPGNIIFSPGYQPTRAAIIDFGEAGVREEEDDESEWAEIVKHNRDSVWLCKVLQRTLGIDLNISRPSVVHTVNIPATVGKGAAEVNSKLRKELIDIPD